ncbi:MAG: hypothetical protein KAR40_03575 [Candidatus Sabulitectum sp.]|nr:hypothetical protein [Candidatus Sabulitectum sp.]
MTASMRPNQAYELTDPKTGITFPFNPNRVWAFIPTSMDTMISEGRVVFPDNPTKRPMQKRFKNELKSKFNPISSILIEKVGLNTEATRQIQQVMGGNVFDCSKPLSLLSTLIFQVSDEDDVIVDFFAGSSVTAHAVMHLNAEDGGNRKFIMVQLPEECSEKSEAFKAGYKTIAEISKERIRRAGKKIKEDLTTKLDQKKQSGEEDLFNAATETSEPSADKLDIGFRVLKIDSSNMMGVYYSPDKVEREKLALFTDNTKPDRSSEDLLFQVLLDWGVDLTLPITRDVISCREVFFVDGNALAACFEKAGEITEEFCKELARREPLRVVFRDSGFKDDSAKINVEQVFKLMSPHTEVKSI